MPVLGKLQLLIRVIVVHHSLASPTSSLFLILEKVTFDLRGLQGEELASQAKYAELVMKVCRIASLLLL